MATSTTRNCLDRKARLPLGPARAGFSCKSARVAKVRYLKRECKVGLNLPGVFSRIQLVKTAAMAVRPAKRSGS